MVKKRRDYNTYYNKKRPMNKHRSPQEQEDHYEQINNSKTIHILYHLFTKCQYFILIKL